MSNEKNTSLFTILLSHTKDLFTSILSYFFLAGNEFTVKIALGLLISTTGGVMFSSKSICDNMITGRSKKNVCCTVGNRNLIQRPEIYRRNAGLSLKKGDVHPSRNLCTSDYV